MQRWTADLGSEVLHTAALVISELVADAVRYAAGGHVSMTLRLTEAAVEVDVCDSNPALPQPGLPDEHSENGRGLFLVAAPPTGTAPSRRPPANGAGPRLPDPPIPAAVAPFHLPCGGADRDNRRWRSRVAMSATRYEQSDPQAASPPSTPLTGV